MAELYGIRTVPILAVANEIALQRPRRTGLANTTRSVLVVDDEPEIRSLLNDLLKDEGYAVKLAKSGAEAIAAVATDAPDLVMMDVKLPDQDGPAPPMRSQ